MRAAQSTDQTRAVTPTADTNKPGSRGIAMDRRSLPAQARDGTGQLERILQAEAQPDERARCVRPTTSVTAGPSARVVR